MDVVRRQEYWCWAVCEVCGAKSPEWRSPMFQYDEGLEIDRAANDRIATDHGFRDHILAGGKTLTVCGVCRLVLAHRQIQESEKGAQP